MATVTADNGDGVPASMTMPTSAQAAKRMELPPATWTASTRIEASNPLVEEPQDVRQVIAVVLNVRSGPSSATAEVGKLPLGTKVTVLGARDRWLQIKAPDGVTGWVHRRYVRRVR